MSIQMLALVIFAASVLVVAPGLLLRLLAALGVSAARGSAAAVLLLAAGTLQAVGRMWKALRARRAQAEASRLPRRVLPLAPGVFLRMYRRADRIGRCLIVLYEQCARNHGMRIHLQPVAPDPATGEPSLDEVWTRTIAEWQARFVAQLAPPDNPALHDAGEPGMRAGQATAAGVRSPASAARVRPVRARPVRHRGVLIEHGVKRRGAVAAPYDAYAVTIEDAAHGGARNELWGVDLQRALDAAEARPGDLIEIVKQGEVPVEVKRRAPDGTLHTQPGHKNLWEVRVLRRAR